MVDREERHPRRADDNVLRDAVHPRDAGGVAGEELGREVAQRRNHARADQLDLLEEPRLARLDLVGLRIAVARRPTLQHVRDVDVGAGEPDVAEQPFEQLAGCADERHALLILVEAGRFADEHQLRRGRPRSEDDLRPGFGESAARARSSVLSERLELVWCGEALSARSHSPRHNTRRRNRRTRVSRRCREQRTRRTAWRPSSRCSEGTSDRRRPDGRAPRNAPRTSCTRTRRSASRKQSRPRRG